MTDDAHANETIDGAFWGEMKASLYEKQAEAWDYLAHLDGYVESLSESGFAPDAALIHSFESLRRSLRIYQDSLLNCIDEVYRLRSCGTPIPKHDTHGNEDEKESLHVDTVSGATTYQGLPTLTSLSATLGVRRGELNVFTAMDSSGHSRADTDGATDG